MKTKFTAELKIRVPAKLKKTLAEAAAVANKPDVSTHVRDILESHQQAAQVADVLERLERLMAAVGPLLKPKLGDDLMLTRLTRLEAIVEEIAMHSSPQVLPRVAARLKTQPIERNVQ